MKRRKPSYDIPVFGPALLLAALVVASVAFALLRALWVGM